MLSFVGMDANIAYIVIVFIRMIVLGVDGPLISYLVCGICTAVTLAKLHEALLFQRSLPNEVKSTR